MKKIIIATIIASLSIFGAPSISYAQSCVRSPLRIIVPRSPGGGLDLLARMVGAEWGRKLGVDVVIDNVEGAGGAIGLTQAYRAPADGQTIVSWSPPGEHILGLQGRVPFKSDEWDMIGATNSDSGFIAVAVDSPFKSLKDIVEASKSGGRRLSVGTVGRTSIGALEAMLYESMFGVTWGLVPFDGGGDLTTALIGGHLDFAVREGGIYTLHPDQLRILSIANATRIKELPDVPTLEEAIGQKLTFAAYRGFAVKKGTPPETLKCLRDAFNEVAQLPSIADEQMPKIGFRYEFLDAEAFAAADRSQAEIADQFKSSILGH